MANIEPIEPIPQQEEDTPVPTVAPLTPEQYVGIKAGVGVIRMIPWPAAPEQWVGIRALSRGETEQAYVMACDYAARMKRAGDQDLIKKALEDNLLWTALRNRVALEQPDGSLRQVVDKPQDSLFSSPDDLRRCVDDEQVKRLLAYYDEHCQTTTPLTRAQALLREQEFDALTAQLKKKPDAIELTACLLTDVLGYLNFLLERVPSSEASET